MKLPIAIGLLLFFQAATAQTEQGRYLIGGNADLSETYSGRNSNFNFSMSPSFAVFAVKNFAIGGKYAVTIGDATTFDASTNSYSSIFSLTTLVGPYLKYYIGKKPVKGVAAFIGGYSIYTQIGGTSILNLNGFALQGSMGLAYFFNRYISIETSMYVNSAGYETVLPSTRIGFSVGLFGFLDKKKPIPSPPPAGSEQ